MSGRLPQGLVPHIDQVAWVVPDVDEAARARHALLGIGPWRVYRQGSRDVHEKEFRGRPGDFSVRYALAQVGDLWFELVEPTGGSSVHSEWLETHGPGLHHLGIFVDDLDASLTTFVDTGFEVVQTGRGYGLDGDGAYAYLDTTALLFVYVELIERPARRRDPDYLVPTTHEPDR